MEMVETAVCDSFPTSLFPNDVTSPESNIDTGLVEIMERTLISYKAMNHIFTINLFIIMGTLSIFGGITNIINIIVFFKMKFKETINIALLGLSLSDLGASVTLLCSSICFSPWLLNSDLPIQILEVQFLSSYTRVIFMRVAAFITVYITLERCISIAVPLKVKQILSPKRVKVIVFMIYFVTFAFMIVGHTTGRLGWKFDPFRNRTVFGIVFNEHRENINTFVSFSNSIFLIASFAIVIVFSGIIVWTLIKRSKWRSQMTTGSDKSSSSRDSQVIKMVVCVALVFIFTLMPVVIIFFAMIFVPDIHVGRKYQNLFFTLASIMGNCEALNSSVNIFIYYKMSSKYKAVFRSWLNLPND